MKKIVVSTLNANKGQLFEAANGLAPVSDADVILLQESGPMDIVKDEFHKVGYNLAHADLGGLAIGVKDRYKKKSSRTHEFPRGINIGAKRGIIAVDLGDVKVASIHKTVATRPIIAKKQYVDLADELSDPYYGGKVIIGGDFNHHPFFMESHEMLKESTGFVSVGINDPTCYLSGKWKTLKLVRFPDRKIDDILYRGLGVVPMHTDIVATNSDHCAVTTVFSLNV